MHRGMNRLNSRQLSQLSLSSVILRSLHLTSRIMSTKSKADVSLANRIWIRCLPHELMLTGKLTYPIITEENRHIKGRVVMMNRFINERLTNTLSRLSSNIHKKASKSKGKKRKNSADDDPTEKEKEISVKLFGPNGEEINGDLHNCHAWSQGSHLIIDGNHYVVEVNPPTVVNLTLPKTLLSGFCVYPYITLEFTTALQSKFSWYRINSNGSETYLSSDQHYIPSDHDVGCKLKVVVTPKLGNRIGESIEVISTNAVERGPESCPYQERHKQTTEFTTPNRLRVLTYNILADVYSDSDFSRDVLFKHCANDFLLYDYRKQLILQEILGFKADVLCLQEMDKRHFQDYYQPLMLENGYQSIMLIKRHKKLPKDYQSIDTTDLDDMEGKTTPDYGDSEIITINEGSAMFYRKNKFRQLAYHTLNISDALENDPLYDDLRDKIKSHDLLYEKLLYRSGTSIQVLVLESMCNPNNRVCVATTHLYFHPQATAVRLIQTCMALRFISHIKSMYQSEHRELPVVFCGDFNSTPEKAVKKFITEQYISADHPVWTDNESYKLEGQVLAHKLELASAYNSELTNYVPEFKACIDYIFYDKSCLNLHNTVDIPNQEVLSAYEGLPNQLFPSDHISLVCDLEWK